VSINPYQAPSGVPAPATDARHRPLVLSVVCLMFFVFSIIGLYPYWLQLPTVRYRFGMAFTVYSAINYLLSIVCFIGFWRMTRWSVYLYLALVLIGYLVGYVHDFEVQPWSLIADGLILAMGIAYYRRMRWRL
jgi:hypothetical protein